MIRLKNVTKSYGQLKAVDNASLDINENEIFGIIGLSGAGKSTLVRLINRLEEPDSGEIWIDNQNITQIPTPKLNHIRKKIGMIFQGFNLFQSRNVHNNIKYPLEISNWNKTKAKERVFKMLSLVGLEDKANSNISQLSGGQKQRIAIARALAQGPKILLCDEATSALDPKTTKAILKLIKDIQREYGLTVVLITHQMEVIKEVCDRVAIMEDGKVIEVNSVENIFSNPETKLAKDFINHIRKDDDDYMQSFKYEAKEGSVLIKLHFKGEYAHKPVINNLIKNCNVTVNILSGDIIRLTSAEVGELVLELDGSKKEIDEALGFLHINKVSVEVLNV